MATRYREGTVREDRTMRVSAALDSFDKLRCGQDLDDGTALAAL